ncbi:hypothetical protein SDC9_158553 [bioreactor metagenome]|uniref:Uncharacterized protein n=1 Tax=bioreactor metagenome TaxID=1076179 RepID=A0A645FCE7_9ZZZZ
MVDAGQEGDQFADHDRLAEHDLIDRQCDHVARRVATGTGIGDLVEQTQYRTAVHLAREVGHVGRHQHGHRQLVGGQIHDFLRGGRE